MLQHSHKLFADMFSGPQVTRIIRNAPLAIQHRLALHTPSTSSRPACRARWNLAAGPVSSRSLVVMCAGGDAKNVLGGELQCCCTEPVTGFQRDGYCKVTSDDFGVHAVCAQVTEEFLEFTKARGNDLSTPHPPSFPGLKPGDRWCLCAARWKEANDAGKAPKVVLESTDAKALDYISLDVLRANAA